MKFHFFSQAAKFLKEQKRHRQWLAVFICLAAVVGLGTVLTLKLNGRAMTKNRQTLHCTLAVHTHTPECYDGEGSLTCGMADYVCHVHGEGCYSEQGELVCRLAEITPHVHTEECYMEQEVLVCPVRGSIPACTHKRVL